MALLRTAAAARFIGVTKKTLLQYCRRRQITFLLYPDGSYRFRQEALELWMAARTVKAD